MRTATKQVKYAFESIDKNEVIKGVKGPLVVTIFFRKLTESNVPGSCEITLSDGVRGIGQATPVQLTASQVLAVQQLLGLTLKKQSGFMYLRFVANHQLYTGKGYVRSKKHVNYNVSFEHYRFMYGVVIGLLSIKPECLCNVVELQYCNCRLYNVVLIQPMIVCEGHY